MAIQIYNNTEFTHEISVWNEITDKDKELPVNLRENALEIETMAPAETATKIGLLFYGNSGISGGIEIRLNSAMQYKLEECRPDWVPFENEIPQPAGDKIIWRIFRAKQGLTVYYNGELVIDHCICADSCSTKYDLSVWQKNITKIKFKSSDTGSLRWRASKQSNDISFVCNLFLYKSKVPKMLQRC